MPAELKQKSRPASASVNRRFWSLLLLVLVLAVTSSAFAVRFSATPFLKNQQQEAITAQAVKVADGVETRLDRHRLLLTFIASTSDIINVVLGYVDNSDIVRDNLAGMQRPAALSWVSLYDVVGDELASFDVRGDERLMFGDEVILSLADSIVAQQPGADQKVMLRSVGDAAYIVLAAPVLNQGFVEGVLVAGFYLDQSVIFPANDIAIKTYMAATASIGDEASSVPEGATVVDLQNFSLSVVLVPDVAAVEAAGRTLLTHAVSAIALVLMVAFGLFAALGRAALVEPHKKLEEQKLALAELAAVAEKANDAIVITDLQGRISWTNPAFERLSGYTLAEAMGRRPGDLLQGTDTDPDAVSVLRNGIRAQSTAKTEIVNYTKDGRPYWVSIRISPLRNEENKCYGFMALSHDVTESRKQRDEILAAKQRIEHQALHDPLTDLPNRRALDLALKVRSEVDEGRATLVRIDLDHFKYVNDTLGHAAGDFALCEVAKILRHETKAEDLAVRVGGDEFVLLLGVGKTSDDGMVVANRILERVKRPKVMGTKTIRIGASFGVASTMDSLLPLEELIVGADAALYEAKDQGRNTVRLYTPDLHRAVLDRRSLAREIRRAIANEEFVPYFQPQLDAKTRAVVGVETLVRWDSPELGLLTPNKFLPIASQLSAVDEIDKIIFRKSVRQITELQQHGIYVPKVSFNVTAEYVNNPDICDTLSIRGPEGPRIAFEILESVLVEEQSDVFLHNLDRLRERDVSIEIDDFGSGHASIVGLMHLRPDVMKIDQQLVMPIIESEMTRGLLKQIVGMAELMGLKVTAEGVETLEHAEMLTKMGCDTLQGFAFARPMTIDDLKTYIESQENPKGAVAVNES